MSAASDFVKRLGSGIGEEFGRAASYRKSRQLLEWRAPNGSHYVVLSGSNKWSPLIHVAFYFGSRFDEASRIEKLLGDAPSTGHISQYSLNVSHMHGLSVSSNHRWDIDIEAPPSGIEKSIADGIRQIAVPFWNRYSTMRMARDALISNDPWCFQAGGPLWRGLLYLDAALGELDHFESWLGTQEAFYSKEATVQLDRVRAALARAR